MQYLVVGHEIVTTQSNELDSFSPDEMLNFRSHQMKFAFAMIDMEKRELKERPDMT
jgi:hypothetical protein